MVRLYLPDVPDLAAPAGLAGSAGAPTGYAGPRRCVLVVDNEEADRMLLHDRLHPLGFEVVQAGSGEECLERLAGLSPDAILMDLAMPGIDGWETVRRLRRAGLSQAPVAIVSANAFDKGLDNDVGIAPEDFLVKPVRLGEPVSYTHLRAHETLSDIVRRLLLEKNFFF